MMFDQIQSHRMTYFLLFVLTLLSRNSECQWTDLWPFDDTEPKLGPTGTETRECDAERCPGFPDTQGFTRPRQREETERNTSPENSLEHPGDGSREDPSGGSDSTANAAVVEVKKDSDSSLTKLGSMLSGGFSQATGYFSRTVENKTNEYVNKVRSAVHEELYSFMESMAKKAGDLFFAPDRLLGIFMQALGQTAKTLIICALCIVVSLIFTQLFYSAWTKIWAILVLWSSVALLHRFMGPDWIFRKLAWIGGYFFQVGNLMVSHPYMTCSVIILLFAATIFNGCIVPVVRWMVRRTQRSPQQKLDSIEKCVLELKGKIEAMEKGQKKILEILKTINKTPNIEE